jgi:uncharacterized protein YndB with AHSA1/START domain
MNTPETTTAVTPAQPGGYRAHESFAAQPDAVFAALTSAEAISRWWAPCTGTGTAGGSLRFLFGDSPVVVEVEAAEPARHVRWLVAVSEPLPEWAGTHIDFGLRATAEGGTALDFCHEGLTERFECYDMCTAGWRQYLPSLVDYVEHGGGTAFGSENDQRAAHFEESRSRG